MQTRSCRPPCGRRSSSPGTDAAIGFVSSAGRSSHPAKGRFRDNQERRVDWTGDRPGAVSDPGRIGHGSMGHVYLASDRRLETDVVVKFPFAGEKASAGSELSRAVRTRDPLADPAEPSPHRQGPRRRGSCTGQPFVVMQFLAGGSLKDRIASGPGGELEPMALRSLRELAARDRQGASISCTPEAIFTATSSRRISCSIAMETRSWEISGSSRHWSRTRGLGGNSLTAPGFLLGTPNYVAPEIVMGRRFDGRVDQYSLAMTVHEVLEPARIAWRVRRRRRPWSTRRWSSLRH